MQIRDVISRAHKFDEIPDELWELFAARVRTTDDLERVDPRTMIQVATLTGKQLQRGEWDVVARVISGCNASLYSCAKEGDEDGLRTRRSRSLYSLRSKLKFHFGTNTESFDLIRDAIGDRILASELVRAMQNRYFEEMETEGESVFFSRFIDSLRPYDLDKAGEYELFSIGFVEADLRDQQFVRGIGRRIEAANVYRNCDGEWDLVDATKAYIGSLEALEGWKRVIGDDLEWGQAWRTFNFEARVGLVACEIIKYGGRVPDSVASRIEGTIEALDWEALRLDRELETDDSFIAVTAGVRNALGSYSSAPVQDCYF